MAILCTSADYHLRSSQALGLRTSDSFSITCWLKADWAAGSRRSFVGLYGPATDSTTITPITAVQIGTSVGNNDLTLWTWGGGTLANTGTGFMNAYVNQWCFIAYTYDGTTHKGYLNGNLVCSGTNANITGYLNQVYINGYPGGGTGEVSNHSVDQYASYRRTLQSDELTTIYNANGSRHGITKDIICRYEFDELSEGITCSTVPDLTGNGNTLTVVGAGTPFTYTYINTLVNSNIRVVQ